VIRVWDASSLKPLYDVDKHLRGITALCFDGYGCMASASYDKTIRLWQAATGLCINTLRGHTTDIYCIDLTKGGRYIASGALAGNGKKDCTLFVWDTISGNVVHAFNQCVETVEKCMVMENGKSVYTLDSAGRLCYWDVDCDEPVQLSAKTSDFSISPDQKYLVVCEKNGVNHLWDIESYERLKAWNAFPEGSISICFSQDGRLLFSGDRDKNIRVWNVFTGQQVNQCSIDRSSEYYSLKLIPSPDGRFMITIGHEDMPKVWYIDWIYKERGK
jgi:WD40 repeat protein